MHNTVLSYIPRDSVVHSLCGTTKLLFLLFFSFSTMLTYDTRVLLALAAIGIALFPISKIRVREVRAVIYFTLAFLTVNMILLYIFSPDYGTEVYGTRTLLVKLFWRYDLTLEELFYLFNFALKYLSMIPVAILFISCTNPSEFASSLNSIGISYKVGYAVSLALRYIPDIQYDYHNISTAQQARGVELGKGEKLWTRIKNAATILLPLILSSLQRIDVISDVMEPYLVHKAPLPDARLGRNGTCSPDLRTKPAHHLLGRTALFQPLCQTDSMR